MHIWFENNNLPYVTHAANILVYMYIRCFEISHNYIQILAHAFDSLIKGLISIVYIIRSSFAVNINLKCYHTKYTENVWMYFQIND